MPHGRSLTSVRDLMAAGHLSAGQVLRFRRRPDSTARVTADGHLVVNGRKYKSPSTAANGLMGGGHANGWLTWSARRGQELVTLADLRGLVESPKDSSG